MTLTFEETLAPALLLACSNLSRKVFRGVEANCQGRAGSVLEEISVLVGREALGGKRCEGALTSFVLTAGTPFPMAVVQQYMAAAEMGVAAAYLMEMGGNGGKITSKEVFKQVYTCGSILYELFLHLSATRHGRFEMLI